MKNNFSCHKYGGREIIKIPEKAGAYGSGNNIMIETESVVTKDIPSNVAAVNNPCKVLREISELDFEYYNGDLKINIE